MSEQKPSAEAMVAAVEAVKSLRMELHEQSRSTIKVAAVFARVLDAFAARAVEAEREACLAIVRSWYDACPECADEQEESGQGDDSLALVPKETDDR